MITTLAIGGMTCKNCVKHVDEALRGIPGVSAVEVNLPEGSAKIVHDPEQSSVASLIEAVNEAGYSASAK
ncbi:MAG TPA: heavy-metal-associated domain-containing protein [Kofleriaceae bacterium]